MGATPRARLFLRGRANVRPRDWAAAMAETVLLAMVLLAFTRLHAVVGTDVATATANALAVQSVEQMLHLNIELATNRWLTEHETVIPAAVLVYRFYYAALLWVLVWIYIRHAEVYVQVRRTFVAMTGLAVLAFWAMPTSPPRFALPGVVDIFAEHDILNSRSTRDMSNGANFTAMPAFMSPGRPGARTPYGPRFGVPTHALRSSRGCSLSSWSPTCWPPGTTTSSTSSEAAFF